MLEKIVSVDQAFAVYMAQFRSSFTLRLFEMLSISGVSLSWFLVAGFLWGLNFFGVQLFVEQSVFLQSMLPSLVVWGLAYLIKRRVKRPRPYETPGMPSAKTNVSFSMDSFPSSHAASSFALAFTLLFVGSSLANGVLLWAILVGYSRLYLGVHFLSDVLGGIALALLCSWVAT